MDICSLIPIWSRTRAIWSFGPALQVVDQGRLFGLDKLLLLLLYAVSFPPVSQQWQTASRG